MLNNHKTTWVCFGCKNKKSCSLKTCEPESVEENNQEENTNLGLFLDADDTDDIILNREYFSQKGKISKSDTGTF